MEKNELLNWLRETDEQKLEKLWAEADAIRRANVGDEVHFRGLIEISNFCVRRCAYCGISAENTALTRYRMTDDEILECARAAADFGYGTVVVQAGEDPAFDCAAVERIVRRIRAEVGLAITLSLGERTENELRAWKEAGADRYLLRFETSNRRLFDAIHPAHGERRDRMEILGMLRRLGYEVGSGIMIGIPGQTWDDLASDILKFRELDLDMIGVGPYLPHPSTPLAALEAELRAPEDEQVPNSEMMTYKTVALTRIACPHANIPSTTALATVNKGMGRELGLMRGANIIMPNLTPPKYRVLYEIYPGKACIYETAEQCAGCIRRRVLSIGRGIGAGKGESPNWKLRKNPKPNDE
ncbi:MAG: [FeFe] hydrogenase H-cluster radical SAM maturase HydE [Candidatus Brocadiia bacterium]